MTDFSSTASAANINNTNNTNNTGSAKIATTAKNPPHKKLPKKQSTSKPTFKSISTQSIENLGDSKGLETSEGSHQIHNLGILRQNILELIKKVEKTGQNEWLFSLNTPLPAEFSSRILEPVKIACRVKLFGKKSISGGTHYFLSLHLQGDVEVPCQRCLENFMHPILIENTIELYLSETRFQNLSIEDEEYDSILVKADLTLLSVLEDEIILATPTFAKHTKCPVKKNHPSINIPTIEEENEQEETTRPFANLAELLAQKKIKKVEKS